MTHKELKKLLELLLYDDVTAQERDIIEAHLAECDECREEFEQLKVFLGKVGERRPAEPSEGLLDAARQQLHAALLREKSGSALRRRISEVLEGILSALQSPGRIPRYAYVLGGIVAFILGGLLGYAAFAPRSTANQAQTKFVIDADFLKANNYDISNVQFLNPDTGDGNVEVSFDAVQHLRTKGSLNDEPVKKLLSYALVNESNAGVRLKSLDLIKTFKFTFPDKEMKTTLIKVLKSDENAGVRREALTALEKFPFDDTVRDAVLFVLTNDPNPGLRIAAIDGLVTRVAGQIWDEAVLRTLQEKTQSEDNKYVRVQTKNLLEDMRKP
ncbi:MAG: HEAT repeat domain-containing protein [Bacteroidota bacterium]|jgi:hypothetical protein